MYYWGQTTFSQYRKPENRGLSPIDSPTLIEFSKGHGVYTGGSNGLPMWFRQVKAPNRAELTRLTHTIAHRVARYLVRQGLLERDTGNIYLTPEALDTSWLQPKFKRWIVSNK